MRSGFAPGQFRLVRRARRIHYTLPSMRRATFKLWIAAALSAGLLELPFPIAGPMPPWRSVFAWFGLAPLLWAVLHPWVAESKRPLRRAFLLGYLCGFLWYCGNCYWVRDTMSKYGDMPAMAPTLLMIGFSAVLGLYFGLFGLALMLVRRATGDVRWALAAAPVLWVALELAAARITSVPWDQLGYSQVDNGLVNQLAPWTGVYGISFLSVAANAFIAASQLICNPSMRLTWRQHIPWALAYGCFVWAALGVFVSPPKSAPTATAVLIQPNLDVGGDIDWPGAEWDTHVAEFARLAGEQCKTYIAGIPQTGAANGEMVCPTNPTHPDLVVWPEAPAPFEEPDPRFRSAIAGYSSSRAGAGGGGRRGHGLFERGTGVARLQLCACDRRGRAARGAVRQDPPCAFWRICAV